MRDRVGRSTDSAVAETGSVMMGAIVKTRLSRRLLVTAGTGALADWTVFAALVALVAVLTGGSVFAVAIVTCARLLPSVVLGPLLAPYAGMLGTRRTLALADAVRASIIGFLPLIDTLPRLAMALLALEFAAAISAATRESAVSAGVPRTMYTTFNTATGVVTYGMLPLGGLLAAALGSVWQGLPFLAAALLHGGNALVVASTPELDGGTRLRRQEVRVLAGVRRVRAAGPLRDTVAGATVGVVAIAMLFSVGSVIAADIFGEVDRYGYLLTLLGAGALGGAWLVHRGQSAASGLLLAGMGSGLLATPAAVVGVVLIGIGAAIAYVETQSRLQAVAKHPEDFAAAFALIKIGTVVALVAAPAAHTFGGTALVAAAMVTVAGAGALWYAQRIEHRSIAAVALTLFARPLLRGAVRIRVDGQVPAGGAVLASNHPNLLDGPLMMSLDDRVRPVARPQTLRYVRIALRWSGAIIVGREAVAAAVSYLRSGGLVWLAPEGRMTGSYLREGRSGSARMAAAAHVPVIPVAIRYHRRDGQGYDGPGAVGTVGPKLRDWRPWRRPTVTVVFGAPIRVAPVGKDLGGTAPEVATAAIMEQVAALSGTPLADQAVLAA